MAGVLHSPRGKRSLAPGVRCVSVLISATLKDLEYWDARAARARLDNKPNASRSGQLRVITREAQILRHNLGTPLNRVSLVADLLRAGAVSADEAAVVLDEAVSESRKLLHGDAHVT